MALPTSVPGLDTCGIIAGNRALPLMFARQARQMGVQRLVAVGFENETDPALAGLVDTMIWLKVGQLNKLIEALRENRVSQCVMLGQIAPRNLFDVRPDLRALGLLLKLKEKNAHTVFGALINELQKEGITVIEATPWLRPLMPGAGFHLGPALTEAQREDVRFGYRIAKETSRLEIGQLVVVKDGVVLAVEGFEGTDQCLLRGGELASSAGQAVAVKVAKEKHDMRFDVPCIGLKTIETCAKAGIQVFALEPGRTLVLEEDAVRALAKKSRLSILTVEELPDPLATGTAG